ncbi:hypothetical protein PF011_g25222, partial [Phytophthora fragariae]
RHALDLEQTLEERREAHLEPAQVDASEHCVQHSALLLGRDSANPRAHVAQRARDSVLKKGDAVFVTILTRDESKLGLQVFMARQAVVLSRMFRLSVDQK